MKNKIVAVGTLSLITLLSFGKNITNANAIDIADPNGWTFKYDYDTVSSRFEITTQSLGSSGFRVPFVQPTSNTFVANYRLGFDLGDGDEEAVTPVGFYFMSQRTDLGTFTQSGSEWYPNNTTIGSNFSTPPVPQKLFLEFTNPTSKNYQVGINVTDSGTTANWNYFYRPSYNVTVGANPMESDPSNIVSSNFVRSTGSILYFYLPAFSDLIINSPIGSTGSVYFRSFWIGAGSTPFISSFEDGYELGLDDGYADGFIDGQDSAESNVTFRISDLLNRVFRGVAGVFTIKVFDQLTMGTILAFPIAFTIFTFIFRLIRGGKA
jgi:hypothetical protein